jgi:hypothetical protein
LSFPFLPQREKEGLDGGRMNDKLHISRFDNLSSFYVRGKKKLHLKRIGRSKNQIGESRPTNISPFMVLQKKTIYPHLRLPPMVVALSVFLMSGSKGGQKRLYLSHTNTTRIQTTLTTLDIDKAEHFPPPPLCD